MSGNQHASDKFDRLRRQAEALIRERSYTASAAPPSNTLELIYELKLHQTELEIQNEELKRAQDELSDLHREYENLYEFAPCGYLILNAKGIITHANLTAVKLLGENRQHLLRSGFSRYIDKSVEYLYYSALAAITKTGQRQSVELPLKAKEDDSPTWVRADMEADRDSSGAMTQLRMVLVDISKRCKAEEERRQLEVQLRHAQKMESLGTLVGGIAHEFNNILSIIIGNNELVKEEVPKDSLTEDSVDEIMDAAHRAKEVVSQLLIFSRQTDMQKEPIKIDRVVTDALKLIKSSTPANIKIKQIIDDNIDPIMGNATQINQVLINLCSNASDALLPTGGQIDIEVRNSTLKMHQTRLHPPLKPGPCVNLRVSDDGCGMNAATLQRIFDPYFTTKQIGKGTGIGLAVVHSIVVENGGNITVESTPEMGSTFSILFPACKGEVEVKPDQKILLPKGNERILIVDDEEALLMLGKHRLENLGYSVQYTTDPKIALEMFLADPYHFDLVITDMAMPHMTGDQLAAQILEIRPQMPIMLCTGYSDTISKETACTIGICAFAMKPISKEDFSFTVRKVLDGAQVQSNFDFPVPG